MFVTGFDRKKIEEQEQWARDEEEQTRCKEEEEDAKSRERRGSDGDGESRARCCWEELDCGEEQRAIMILAVAMAMATARMAVQTKSSQILPTCGKKRQERIKTMLTRGKDNPL
jgi:hypothetical protein